MPYCAVPSCRNGTSYSNSNPEGTMYHAMPKQASLASQWWLAIRATKPLSCVKDPRVCSAHFRPTDYARNLQFELLNPGRMNPRRNLIVGAIPSLKISASSTSSGGDSARKERLKKRERRSLVKKLLQDDASRPVPVPSAPVVQDRAPDSSSVRRADDCVDGSDPYDWITFEDCAECEADSGGFAAGGVIGNPETKSSASTTGPKLDISLLDASRRTPLPAGTFVARAREILEKRRLVNELEDRCRGLLVGRQPEPVPGLSSAVLGTAAEQASAGGAAKHPDDPLAVLRKPSDAVPQIIRKLEKHGLPVDVNLFPPANMQDALDVIHQLRMQNLAMKEDFLRWVIKNKKKTDMKDEAAKDRLKKASATSVTRRRLKELEELETSVERVFTESQIRALTSNYSANCVERKKVVHWREEDMRRSLELRAVSSEKVLNYVRHKMQIPLPCMETVKHRCGQFPELSEMYKAVLKKTNTEASHCEMCQRQLGTIEAVAGGTPVFVTDNADEVSREDRLNAYVDQAYQDTPPRRKSTGKASRLKQAVGSQRQGGLGKRGPESDGRFQHQKKLRGDEWEDSESSSDQEAYEDTVKAILGFSQYNRLKNWRVRGKITAPVSATRRKKNEV